MHQRAKRRAVYKRILIRLFLEVLILSSDTYEEASRLYKRTLTTLFQDVLILSRHLAPFRRGTDIQPIRRPQKVARLNLPVRQPGTLDELGIGADEIRVGPGALQVP